MKLHLRRFIFCLASVAAFVMGSKAFAELPFNAPTAEYDYIYRSTDAVGGGGDYWYLPVSRPPGVSVQWLSFYMYGVNFFSQLPSGNQPTGQHFVAGTRMTVQPEILSITGLGSVAGPSEPGGIVQGCGTSASYAVVERWLTDPFLQKETCSNMVGGVLQDNGTGAISDGIVYKVTVGTSDSGWVYYEYMDTGTGNIISRSWFANYTPPGDRVFVFPLYGGLTGDWGVAAWGLQYGWY
jgi:hypothetical protein